ncbi:hypothetical protein [Bradyrhizobium embrapense]|uniref:hypothetical protein n=1 Tax=Bradyrhizobium embrapense TaxID=630921 RepID=UPI000A6EB746|nr:hypothetical protein [Bradyrhizobium embrapense]
MAHPGMTRCTPDTFDLDLTGAYAVILRAYGMTYEGTVDEIEARAFKILWNPGEARPYSQVKPRLTAAIALARRDGAIDLSVAA